MLLASVEHLSLLPRSRPSLHPRCFAAYPQQRAACVLHNARAHQLQELELFAPPSVWGARVTLGVLRDSAYAEVPGLCTSRHGRAVRQVSCL